MLSGGGVSAHDPCIEKDQESAQQCVGVGGVVELLAGSAVEVAATVLHTGDEEEAHVPGVGQIVAGGVGVEERCSLDPVLVGGVDIDDLGAGVGGGAAFTTACAFAGEVVRQDWVGEGEDGLGVEVVLAVAFGSVRLGEAVIDVAATAAAYPVLDAVEDLAALLVLVEAEGLVVVEMAGRVEIR